MPDAYLQELQARLGECDARGGRDADISADEDTGTFAGTGTLPCSVLQMNTVLLFTWQRDTVGLAHYIKDVLRCSVPLMMLPDDASTSSSSALAAG